jgi:hypothetical protein
MEGIQRTTIATKAAADYISLNCHADKVHRWLRPPDPSTNANYTRKLGDKGTSAWVLENPVFQLWKSSSRRHLRLYGLSGCGKTVLNTTVLDHLARVLVSLPSLLEGPLGQVVIVFYL